MHVSCRNIRKYKKSAMQEKKGHPEESHQAEVHRFYAAAVFWKCSWAVLPCPWDPEAHRSWVDLCLAPSWAHGSAEDFFPALLGLDCSSYVVYLEWSPILSCPSPLPSGSLLNPSGLKLLRTLGHWGHASWSTPGSTPGGCTPVPWERSPAPQKILVNSSAKRPSPSSRGEREKTKGWRGQIPSFCYL